MKLKGVGFFEQHVEKIVLAAVSAVFLGVVAMQFLYEPNKIKVGNEPPLPPGLAFEPVKKKAEMVQSKMTATAESLNLPAVPKVNLVDQFTKRHADPVAPTDRIASLGKGVEVEGIAVTGVHATGTQRLVALQIPATSTPVACSYRNTFDPTEPIATPELKKLLPEVQPLDKASVSVEAAFDGTAFKAALLGTTKTEENASSYPANWWRDQVELLGVKLERQEQTTDGQWGEVQEVATAPGRGIPDLLKTVKAQTDIPDLLGTARGASDDLLRPAFYRVIAGPQWKKPSEAGKGGDVGKAAETKKLLDQRGTLLKEQDAFKKQLEKLGAPKLPPPGGGGGGGGGKGGGGAQQPVTREGIRDPKEDPRYKQLQDRLKKTEENLTKNESDLRILGVDADGNPLPADAVAANNPALAAAPKPLLDNPSVPVWAHDLTVTPGKTYRYRVKVLANNPAFGRGAGLIAEQQDLGKSPVIESAPSEWSAPVAVLADKYYYIVSATEADPQGPARARAELYQFFYGYYRSCQVYLEPGDVLAGPVKLPDAAKLPIYDLTKLAAAEPGQPVIAPQPDRNPAAPNLPSKLGTGRGGMQVNEGGGDRRQAAAAGQDKPKVTLPDNAKPWSGPVRVEFDTFMLDVAKIPGAIGGAKVHTFLRGPDGATIVTRATAEDEKEDTYRILAASSKDGENQGQPVAPVAPVKKPDGPAPNQQGPNRPPPPPPPGGGGGGGGGGG